MTELEKLRSAKTFIEKLANGYDPLTDQPIPEDELINNVQISRCLFYVSDVLGQVIEQGGNIGCGFQKPAKKSIAEAENHGKPWDTDQEKMLTQLFQSGCTVREISALMRRTKGGIESRLKKLGLIEKQPDAE